MTQNTITHRHRLDKVSVHIPSLLKATTCYRRYVLYITDPDAVDQCSHEESDSPDRYGQRHYRVFAHQRHTLKKP
jgi:hypothetical protein